MTAADDARALETIRAEQPNLVFLDVMIPKMIGFDVCNAIKHELGLKEVYVVMLTAKGQEFDKQRGSEVGADVYMTKPFDSDELFEGTDRARIARIDTTSSRKFATGSR